MQIPFQLKNEIIYLTADENNYCLSRVRERTRDGVTTTEFESFKWFANLNNAFNSLIDMKVRASDAKNMLELKQVLISVRAEVMQVWESKA